MTKIYVYRLLPDVPYLPVLYPQFGRGKWFEKHLYSEGVFKYYDEPFFELVDEASKADFILVPHIYKYVSPSYIAEAESFAEKSGKPLILSAFGDSDAIRVSDKTVVLRYTQYRHCLRRNDIMMPTESPGASLEGIEFVPRKKKNSVPVIGFCGWAEYKNAYDALKGGIKNAGYGLRAALVGVPALRARKKGIYFRKKAIAALRRSPLVKADFMVRRSFTSHKETISLDAERARREFIDNILASDLSLAVKGDGNASTRFYEILALGRIPVVVDTDAILPFEDIIDYGSFCLIIPFEKIEEAGERVRRFYDAMTPEEYERKQQLAREAFETRLRGDKFYRHLFSHPREILQRIGN